MRPTSFSYRFSDDFMATRTNSTGLDPDSLDLAQTLSSTLVDHQIIIILSSVFFGTRIGIVNAYHRTYKLFALGILTMLLVASTYTLMWDNLSLHSLYYSANSRTSHASSHGLRRTAVRLLLASTVALYVSSVMYWATLLEFSISASELLVNAVGQLRNPSSPQVTSMGLSNAPWACILTAAFTVNVSGSSSSPSRRVGFC